MLKAQVIRKGCSHRPPKRGIIDTPDALLVADRAKSQDVKLVVEALNGYADASFTEYLPPCAGHGAHMLRFVEETTIRSNASPSSQVRSSAFNSTISAPNTGLTQGKLSYKSVMKNLRLAQENIVIFPYEKHRLTNIGEAELVLIEVQVGDYLGEDDIVRLDDDYGRV